jgi:curved DNA-binding protein CbpA
MDDRPEQEAHDPYEVLQLHPKAHPLIVMRAFRVLAAMYHPDNKQTGDRQTFENIVSAYRLLSDPVRRAAYDRGQGRADNAVGTDGLDEREDRRTAPDEQRLRLLILTTLYNARRSSLSTPGLPLRVLVDMTDAHLDDVQFSLWYLRGKKFVEVGEHDAMAITVAGVDYVESNARRITDEFLPISDGDRLVNERRALGAHHPPSESFSTT